MNVKKSKGNMYGFVNATWNPISGRCYYDCSYCYMKRWSLGDIHFKENDFEKDVKAMKAIAKEFDNPIIFVGSGIDLFNPEISNEAIIYVLETISMLHEITFLLQSKNTKRMYLFPMPRNTIITTTVETDVLPDKISKAPSIEERLKWLKRSSISGNKTMVTIEPIMKFNSWFDFANSILETNPFQVNIGANTNKQVKLLEPSRESIIKLINALKRNTVVHIKPNLKRLLQ